MKRLVILCLCLAACGTPQDQCIARETRELRTIDRLIAETEGNLARGYAIQPVVTTVKVMDWCIDRRLPDARPQLCWQDQTVTRDQPKAIDPAAEARKLEGLQQKRAALARAAEPLIAQCKATYPD